MREVVFCARGLMGGTIMTYRGKNLDEFLEQRVVYSGSVYHAEGEVWYGSREQLRAAILQESARFLDEGAGI